MHEYKQQLKNFKATLFLLLSIVFIVPAEASAPLPVEQAFQLSVAHPQAQTIQLDWQMQPGYFLYAERFDFTPTDVQHLKLGGVHYTPATRKIYDHLTVTIPVTSLIPGKTTLIVRYQGCSHRGYCYPPQTQQIILTFNDTLALVDAQLPNQETSPHPLWLLISFFGFGLLLAFTPCVLPMVPVLSGIILRQQAGGVRHAFLLSLSYVIGSATMYAVIGGILAMLGQYLPLFIQSTWVTVAMAGLLILLALNLFEILQWNLPMPAALQTAHSLKKGPPLIATAIMGALSTLILSPCLTAPLIGAITYIAHTGHVLWGALALFFLGLGAGTPLLLFSTSLGHYLPKSGQWMIQVKRFFGLLLMGLAGYLLYPLLLPAPSHGTETVHTLTALQASLQRHRGQPVILDYYADWCADCRLIASTILPKAEVQAQLQHVTFITVDVTQNNAETQALLKAFQVVAPPTFVFLSRSGQEQPELRLVGMFSTETLLKHLRLITSRPTS